MTPAHRITTQQISKKQKNHFKPRQDTNKQYSCEENHKQYYKEDIIVIKHAQARKDLRSVVIQNILMDLDVQQAHPNVRIAISLVISVAYATRRLDMKTKGPWESRSPKAHQLKIASVCVQDSICGQSGDFTSSDESFCLQMKIKSNQAETPAPQHLITNLAYKVKTKSGENLIIKGKDRHLC